MSTAIEAPSFFVAGGTLGFDSPSYVKRPADDELFNSALAGEFCYVLTPRQMGKSSLMIRTARRLQERGVSTAIIDLTGVGTNVNIEQWYLGLITRLKAQLKLSVEPNAWWAKHDFLSAVQRFTDFMHDVVLVEVKSPVVIFIDEIDTTLNLDFSDDFFAAIRFVYNARTTQPAYKRLTFILLGVAAPADLIKDPSRTPFNIGHRIDLHEFSREDAEVLRKGLETVCPERQEAIFNRIFYWTNGHPYLTQKLCLTVAETGDKLWNDERVDELVKSLFLSKEARKEANLQFVRDRILTYPHRRQLFAFYSQVYKGKRIADDERSLIQNHLKLSGLVRDENGYLRIRNMIYRRAFDSAWVQENTPINWVPIMAIAAGIVALLAGGLIAYNFWIGIQLKDSIANFYDNNSTPGEQLANLAKVFRLQSPLESMDYDYKAKELFYDMQSREEQLALFSAHDSKGADLVVVIRGLYVTLADVSNTNSTTPLLGAMAGALDRLDKTKETTRLSDEINSWLQARELVWKNPPNEARAEYDKAIALNGDNPATRYERAKVLIQLSEFQQALNDLDQVMAIAQKSSAPTPTPPPTVGITAMPIATETPPPTFTPDKGTPTQTLEPDGGASPVKETLTPTPTPKSVRITSEFATYGQMVSAVKNLIYGNPNLVSRLASASSEYANLRKSGLVPVRTSPEQAVIDYYQLINQHRYEEAWAQLSDGFKQRAASDYDGYVREWSTVGPPQVDEVRLVAQTETTATVNARVSYSRGGQPLYVTSQSIRLVLDTKRVAWLFDGTSLLLLTVTPNATSITALTQTIASIPASTPTPATPGPTDTPVPGLDAFEPNYDFDHAAGIGLNVKYTNINFVPLPGQTVNNDFFKVSVKSGMLVTCETLDLSAGTDTNMILYDDNRSSLAGNDDVDKLRGELRSKVAVGINYDGFLYILVGQGSGVPSSQAIQYNYSLQCTTPGNAVATPPPLPSTSTHPPSPIVGPTRTPIPIPSATLMPILLPAPKLIKPGNDSNWPGYVQFEWTWDGTLSDESWYFVRAGRSEIPDINTATTQTWEKGTSWQVSDLGEGRKDGWFHAYVVVIGTWPGNAESCKPYIYEANKNVCFREISERSEIKRFFYTPPSDAAISTPSCPPNCP